MDTIPQIGDLWFPNPDVPYVSPAFVIVDRDGDRNKIWWFGSNQWCWYSDYLINKEYFFISRGE